MNDQADEPMRASTITITIIGAVAAMALPFGSHAAAAAECSGGVCTININAPKLRLAPCKQHAVLLAYSQMSGATLVQCSKPGDSTSNESYAFDRGQLAASGVPLTGTRFIRNDFLAEAASEGIPDRFAPVPLCAAPRPVAGTPGEVLLVAKAPSGKDGVPYCYRLLRLSRHSGAIQVRGDDGSVVAASSAAAVRWQRLAAALASQIEPRTAVLAVPAASSARSAPGDEAAHARVSAKRATLFDQADRSSATRQYLIEGDEVQILDASRRSEGWLKVSYVRASGAKIERWVQADDLAAAGVDPPR